MSLKLESFPDESSKLQKRSQYTDKKELKICLIYKEIQIGAVA
jgi:hypothetical protein